MAWEDGTLQNVEALIEAADQARSKARERELLQQALSSAKCIKDDYRRTNLVALIEAKLQHLS